jgi:hypothetical protein
VHFSTLQCLGGGCNGSTDTSAVAELTPATTARCKC